MNKNNIPSVTGIVSIENLPEEFMVDISKGYKNRLFSNVKKYVNSWLELSKKLNLDFRLFNGEKQRNRLKQLKFFKRICKFLEERGHSEFNIKNLEKNITYIKSHYGNKGIRNPKIPFNFNNYCGGCFLSGIFHDGCIKSNLSVNYCNKKQVLIDEFINATKYCLGEVELGKDRYTTLLPKIIGELLVNCLKIKHGKKTTQEYYVPKFIFKSNKEFISGYLNYAVSDDGSVQINTKYNIYKISISIQKDISNIPDESIKKIKSNYKSYLRYCSNILKADKKILEKFNINVNGPFLSKLHTYTDKEGVKRKSLNWGISITNLIDIEIFYNNIKLTHTEKQEKLEKIMEIASMTHRQTRKGNVYKWVLEHCNILSSRNTLITASNLSKSLERSLGRTQWILKRMKENNLLEKIGKIPRSNEYIYEVKNA